MIIRYGVSIVFGTAVTFALLFLMHLLIDTGRGALTNAESFRIDDFVRIERSEAIETRKDKPEKPPEPKPPPEIPNLERMASADTTVAVTVSVVPPDLEAHMNVQSIGFGISDGEYLPIVKVAPAYPQRAISRSLEGYVIVQFTVTRSGTTRDVIIIESTDEIFDRAAVGAASKFKYRPRVIGGEPVEVPGVLHRIIFLTDE